MNQTPSLESIGTKLEQAECLLSIFAEFVYEEIECELKDPRVYEIIKNRLSMFMSTLESVRDIVAGQRKDVRSLSDSATRTIRKEKIPA